MDGGNVSVYRQRIANKRLGVPGQVWNVGRRGDASLKLVILRQWVQVPSGQRPSAGR